MTRSVRSTVLGVLFVAAIAGGLVSRAQAQSVFSWTNGGGDMAWTTALNWTSTASGYPGSVSTTDTATFGSTSTTGAFTIGSPITIGALTLFNTGGLDKFTGGPISLSDSGSFLLGNINKSFIDEVNAPVTLLGSGTIGSANNNATGVFKFSGGISGAGTLTISPTNTGLISLTGNNSGFTGVINVISTSASSFIGPSNGLFQGNLGNATAINFTNGAWRAMTSGNTVPMTINPGWTYFQNAGNVPASINITSGGSLTIDTGNGNTTNYSGPLTGPGLLAIRGRSAAGNLFSGFTDIHLTGTVPNTLSGSVIVQAGMLNFQMTPGVNAIGTANVTVGISGAGVPAAAEWRASNQINGGSNFNLLSASSGTLNNGWIVMNGFSDTIGGLMDNGSLGTALVMNQAPGTSGSLTLAPSAGMVFQYGGLITNGLSSGQGTLSLHMGGAGNEILSGTESYTGGTTVNSGTLSLNGLLTGNASIGVSGDLNGIGTINFGSGSPSGEITVNSSGTLDASTMQWNIAGLTVNSATLADFTSGGKFIAPGTLESLLTPASQALYTLQIVGSQVVAVAAGGSSWNVDASANWSSSASWSGGNVPNSSTAVAKFGSVITAPRTVNVDIPVTVGSMSFANTNQYTLQDTTGTNSITFDNGSSDGAISVTAGSHVINTAINIAGNGALDLNVTPSTGTLTISGAIGGFSSVVNTVPGSTGTVLLTGANSFSGGLNVQGGAVYASSLSSSIPVVISSGGTFGLTSGTTNMTIQSLNSQAADTVINVNGGTLNVASNGNGNIYGLTGAGAVTLTAAGPGVNQNLGQNSNFTGSLAINNGTIATPLGAATAFGAAGGTATLSNVTWNGYGSTGESFDIVGGTTQFGNFGGTPTLSGNIGIENGATFYVNTGGGNSGIISGSITGTGNFVYIGGPNNGFEFSPIVLTGTASNTFSGTTTVEQGDLQLQKTGGAFAISGPLVIGVSAFSTTSNTSHVVLAGNEQIDPSVTVSFGTPYADLRLEGWNETVGGLTSNVGNGKVGNWSSVANSILTLAGSGNYSFGGSLVDSTSGASGNLAVVMTGSGTQILSGSNTYSGGTTISGGGLLTVNGSLAHANVSVSAGTLNGSGKITFNPGEEIVVGAGSAFDSSAGMKWDVTALTGSPVPLVDYTSGGTYIAPAILDSLLTRDSQFLYTLSNSGGMVDAVTKPQNAWNVDASGNWSDITNWSTGVAPNSQGALALFTGAITASRTATVNEPVTVGMMMFNNTNQYTLLASAASNSITLNNGGLNSVIESTLGSHVISAPVVIGGNGVLELAPLSSSGTLTIAGNISQGTAAGVLTVDPDSTGTVVLTGSDTFTGGVSVHGGALLASKLASTIAVSVDGGATFGVSGPAADLTVGSLNATATNAAIAVNGGTLNIAANADGNNVYGLTGAGTVVLTAASSSATQNLGNNSAFTGRLFINNGNIATPLGAAGAFTANGGTTTLNSVTWGSIGSTGENFEIAGGSSTFVMSVVSATLSGSIAIDPAATLVYNGGSGGTLSGVISGSGTLIDEASTLGITGAQSNTFSGNTIVQQGTMTLRKTGAAIAIAGPLTIGAGANVAVVQLGSSQQISPSVIVSFGNNSSSLHLNAFQQTVGGLTSNSGNGEVGNYGGTGSTLTIATVGNNTYGGALDDGFGGSSLALVVSGSGSQSITGPITFSGALEVNSGTLILSGSNTYLGNTIVQGGQLIVANSYSLPDGGGLIVGSGAGSLAPVIGGQAAASSVAAVPEPGTLALAAAGLIAGAVALRRRKAPRVS